MLRLTIMSVPLFVLLSIIIFFKIIPKYDKSINDSNKNSGKIEGTEFADKIRQNGHGHRCYIDGLSTSELYIVNLLSQNLDHKDYFIFNNLIIPSEVSKTAQIDHVVVSKYGIFVIESKKYKGWIFAGMHDKKWTQRFFNGKTFQFGNPILQNFGHVCSIKNVLPFASGSIYNVVVFMGECEFKNERIDNVLYASELIEHIKMAHTERINESTLMMVIGKLSHLCQTVDVTNSEHTKNIKKYTRNK